MDFSCGLRCIFVATALYPLSMRALLHFLSLSRVKTQCIPYRFKEQWTPYASLTLWTPYLSKEQWTPYLFKEQWTPYLSLTLWTPYLIKEVQSIRQRLGNAAIFH